MFIHSKFRFHTLSLLLLTLLFIGCNQDSAEGQNNPAEENSSILIFSKTEGFRHGSIETGAEAVQKLVSEEELQPLHTENAAYFHPDSLASFEAVIFLNTTGDILNDQQQQHFEQFIQQGGGFVGIHAAADTEYEWPWYGNMVGAYFVSHPAIQEATLNVIDQSHPATSHLPSEWVRTDEWYNYKEISDQINVLIELDESSYEGGENGDYHPISWYHDYDGGRAFYTGLGHTEESYSEPHFLDLLRGALDYVLEAKAE
ncbi:ThuA domain-containing protein [Fodinibius salsisoli]|uniref:ThuA domain-containing protein n=1 Tax=Fodinibius salsisoli TaxID=2820877 RepID=A0ABT3PRK8_9BACT|nr:ThuA domain-containing protein [Fodinibius salsisoli]MCW9708502.1 ThuA domain-containing protein [Fodinibius salsisoli]